jgi:hypothetical protein
MNPATGRFLSADPFPGSIRSPVSLHDYLYANTNPVNVTDPSGLFSLIELSVGQSIQNTLQSVVQVGVQAQKVCQFIEAAKEIENIGLIAQIARAVIGGVFGSVFEQLLAPVANPIGPGFVQQSITLVEFSSTRGSIRKLELRTLRDPESRDSILRLAFDVGGRGKLVRNVRPAFGIPSFSEEDGGGVTKVRLDFNVSHPERSGFRFGVDFDLFTVDACGFEVFKLSVNPRIGLGTDLYFKVVLRAKIVQIFRYDLPLYESS